MIFLQPSKGENKFKREKIDTLIGKTLIQIRCLDPVITIIDSDFNEYVFIYEGDDPKYIAFVPNDAKKGDIEDLFCTPIRSIRLIVRNYWFFFSEKLYRIETDKGYITLRCDIDESISLMKKKEN